VKGELVRKGKHVPKERKGTTKKLRLRKKKGGYTAKKNW